MKSLFLVEDENATAEKTATPSKPTSSESAPSAPQPTSTARPHSAGPGQIDDKFLQVLFKAMEQANIQGFDYLEYKQSLRNLAKMPMDEATRYQSAYAMAQTLGATPQQLVETANHYLKVLQAEEQKFGQALNSQKDQQIGQRVEQLKSLQAAAAEKAKMIDVLKKEIADLEEKQKALQSTIEEATVKVESTKNDFVASYQSLVAQIVQDVEKMKQYLK
ncbi:MAG: hypothetical protein KDC44_10505 [Phaeodactylibacter sp.]|nr:hypothetical protein [Phaeodactylibacter sp.]